jgi:hypothetical protein
MIARFAARFGRHQGGAAAIEVALIGGMLIVAGLNAVDVARYGYETSEVNAAAQAGAEAALAACDIAHTPATLNCAGLSAAVSTGLHSTRLAANVTLSGPITENYYCLDTSGVLQWAGPASAQPPNCGGIKNPGAGATPTLYLQVPAQFAFQPMFPGASLARSFPQKIVRTAWMRMA